MARWSSSVTVRPTGLARQVGVRTSTMLNQKADSTWRRNVWGHARSVGQARTQEMMLSRRPSTVKSNADGPAGVPQDQAGSPQAAAAIASYEASSSSIEAAAMFSSRCATEPVPGIGIITGERLSSQARAT